ncbi:MAG: T9SS type A sorting domain-containing protein [Chitinophagales bacterium]|nr:T9SS type A sorting domain-containing protein [Chitinophagales bacterium]
MKTKFFYTIVGALFLWHTTIAQSPAWQGNRGERYVDVNRSDKDYTAVAYASGNVYRMGSFSGRVDFDPGPGSFYLTSEAANDMFIQKSDALGHLIWVKDIALSSVMNGRFIASRSDDAGRAYVTSPLGETSDFDQAKFSDLKRNSYSVGDIFILKLDPSGNFIWCNNIATSGQNINNSLTIDATGNIYSKGSFSFKPEQPDAVADKELTTGNALLELYPNPTSGNFIMNLQLNEDVNEIAIVQVYDALGRLVKSNNSPFAHGVLFDEMKLDNTLAEGMYSVRVTVNNKTLQRQLIYQR